VRSNVILYESSNVSLEEMFVLIKTLIKIKLEGLSRLDSFQPRLNRKNSDNEIVILK